MSLNFLVWQMGKKVDCLVPPAETGVGWNTLVDNQGELVSSRAFVHASGLLGHHVRRLISKHIHLFLM